MHYVSWLIDSRQIEKRVRANSVNVTAYDLFHFIIIYPFNLERKMQVSGLDARILFNIKSREVIICPSYPNNL
jgi:hypothetical protein